MEIWRRELYLAHHGILGMKWGRRQGPPYPLDAQDHSAAEKKAGWRKSLDGGSGEESKPKKRLTKGPPAGNIKSEKTKKHIPKFYSEEPEWTPITDSDDQKPKEMPNKDVSKGKDIAKKALLAIGLYAAYTVATDYAMKKAFGIDNSSTLSPSSPLTPATIANARDVVLGLVQRNANTPITSLGKTFSNAKEFANHVESIHNNTISHEKKLFDNAVWHGALSKDQRNAIKAYSGNDEWLSYNGMNKLLRFGEEKIPEKYRDTVKKLTKDCEEALNKSRLDEDAISYRGVPLHTLNKMFGGDFTGKLTKENAEKLLETKFTEKAFYSSAIDESSSFHGVKITTIIPKGMKAMYIAPVSKFPGEKELLVQRGTSFAVKDFTTDAAGMIIALTIEAFKQP